MRLIVRRGLLLGGALGLAAFVGRYEKVEDLLLLVSGCAHRFQAAAVDQGDRFGAQAFALDRG